MLSKDSLKPHKQDIDLSLPVAASAKIYKMALVAVTSAGYAAPAADTAGMKVRGFAIDGADNSAGAAGAVRVKVQKKGRIPMKITGATQAVVGKTAYVVDDETVTADAADTTNDIPVGTIDEFVSAPAARDKTVKMGLDCRVAVWAFFVWKSVCRVWGDLGEEVLIWA